MRDDKPTPFRVDRRNVGEKRQKTFESRSFTVGLARSKPQPISVYRSRTYIPELDDVLWSYAYAITRNEKGRQGCQGDRVHGVGLVRTAEQDVGVGKVLHEFLFAERQNWPVLGPVEGQRTGSPTGPCN